MAYADRFDADYQGPITGRNVMSDPAIHAGMPKRDLEHLVALYDGEIAFTDDIVRDLLDEMKKRGRFENSLIVITADHGEEFFEHRGRGHQRTLFDEVIRVPLIVRLPGGKGAGRRVATQVSLVDLMPTVLSRAGLPMPQPASGRDLSPLLAGEPLSEVPTLCELRVNRRRTHALRRNDAKLIADGMIGWYYDLKADPGEKHSKGESTPGYWDTKVDLQELLARSAAIAAAHATPTDSESPIPADVRERLESLGYLDGAAP